MTRRKDPTEIRTPLAEMEAAGHHLPAFEPQFDPVPRKFRHDGWTPERQRAFIAALADTGYVSQACAIVGMTAVGAYYLRRQPGAESFAAAWRAAQTGTEAAPPDPLPLTLRGMMHVLEAAARRRRERAAEAGLSDAEIDDMNAAIMENFTPVP